MFWPNSLLSTICKMPLLICKEYGEEKEEGVW